jgi:hypothetical protein
MSIRRMYTMQEVQRLQAIRSAFNNDPKMVAALNLAIDVAIGMSEHFLIDDITKFTDIVTPKETVFEKFLREWAEQNSKTVGKEEKCI